MFKYRRVKDWGRQVTILFCHEMPRNTLCVNRQMSMEGSPPEVLPDNLHVKLEYEDKDDKETIIPISPSTSEDEEPQMSTPDDPVIHSPPSLRGPLGSSPSTIAAALSQNSPLGYGQSPEEGGRTSCDSPGSGSADGTDADGRRRQKTCRVCGDHATGYNFNVITCESCKAFFRRNALRPKEFKCPYSEDCDINAVSRRFCQKCRLRKCFAVGMKKEWILNEEQLRRRKNSRLNNLSSQNRGGCNSNKSTPNGKSNASSPVNILTPDFQVLQIPSPLGRVAPLLSPPSTFPLLSPTESTTSDSPPTRHMSIPCQGSPEYESNLMMQQRLASVRNGTGMGSPLAPVRPLPKVDPGRNQVVLSIDEYTQLMQRASQADPAPFPPFNITDTSPAPGPSFPDLSKTEDVNNKIQNFFDATINEEMAEEPQPQASYKPERNPDIVQSDRKNYELNTAELRALDVVREAFSGMNDQMEAGRQRDSFMKDDKTPTDVLNIMDVTMRRLVKMAKKLPAFNELSQEGKFALLKGSMIEMLTVRGISRFDSKSNSWKTPTVPSQYQVSINIFDSLNLSNRDSQKSEFIQFVRAIPEDLRKNDLAISMIMLIVLFTVRPNVHDANDRILVERYNQEYSSLLNRYLESLYGEDARKFQEILPQTLRFLRVISANAINLFIGTSRTEEAEPLPKEFFRIE